MSSGQLFHAFLATLCLLYLGVLAGRLFDYFDGSRPAPSRGHLWAGVLCFLFVVLFGFLRCST